MADHRITDFVAPEAIQSLKNLKEEIDSVKAAYVETSKELIKGINMNVSGLDDLEKLSRLLNDNQKKAADATERLKDALTAEGKALDQTTASISRQLDAVDKANAASRETFNDQAKVKKSLDEVNKGYEDSIKKLNALNAEIRANAAEQKELTVQYNLGTIGTQKYTDSLAKLVMEERSLKQEKANLNTMLKNEERAMHATTGSYNELSQQLALMKKAYRDMTEEERKSSKGQEMLNHIRDLSNHLKDIDQTMGDFQRNVGNYAIAQDSVKKQYKDLVLEIATLTREYQNMSDAERSSAEGRELKEKIKGLTEDAGALKDTIADVNQAITNAASDTRAFDQISEGVGLLIDGFGLATGAAEMLGLSEDDLVEVQTKLQAAIVASNAVASIQNKLQKQSALMQGVGILQTKAAAVAENIKTAAVGKGVVVTKAATVAQAIFNAVAQANPYVILAAAVVTVVGALLAFTLGTKEATKAEEKHQKELERTKKREEDLANAIADGASAQISAFMKLKREWDSLGDAFKKKEDFIHKNRKAMDKLGLSIRDVGKAEKIFRENTDAVVKAFILRAKAAALQSEMEESYKRWIAERVKAEQNMAKKGDTVSIEDAAKANWAGVERTHWWSNDYIVTDADKYNGQMKPYQLSHADDTLKKELDFLTEEIHRTDETLQKLYGEIGMVDGSSSDGSSGGKVSEKKDNSKTLDQFNDEALKKGKTLYAQLATFEKEGTEKWLEYKKASIKLGQELELRTASKTHETTLKELKESLEAKKITEEQYKELVEKSNEQHQQNIVNINTSAQNSIEEATHRITVKLIEDIESRYSAESVLQERQLTEYVAYRKQKYAEDLAAAGDSLEERDRITMEYEKDMAERYENNAVFVASKQIEMLEEVLDIEDLTADEREKLAEKLAKAKSDLEVAIADQAIAQQEREREAIEKTTQEAIEAYKKRMEAAQKWLQIAANGLNAINELASAVFDAKIQRIEEEMDANNEAGEKETELVSELVEKKVITQEEGEARKRAAEAKTAKKNEELEKKKQQLQYKQAVWNKANSIAQVGLSTAMAIMSAMAMTPPNIPLAAIAASMGALQLATVIATPIPKYAKGVDYHPGGLAVVGDAGKQEVVEIGGDLYITPAVPTLIDMPKGAVVYPDIDTLVSQSVYDMPTLNSISEAPNVVVNNDYARLERQMGETNSLIRKFMKQQHSQSYYSNYQDYKRSRL